MNWRRTLVMTFRLVTTLKIQDFEKEYLKGDFDRYWGETWGED